MSRVVSDGRHRPSCMGDGPDELYHVRWTGCAQGDGGGGGIRGWPGRRGPPARLTGLPMPRSPLCHCLIANIASNTAVHSLRPCHVLRRELADRIVLDRHDLERDWDSTRARRSYSPSSIALHALPTIRALVSPSRSHTREATSGPPKRRKGHSKAGHCRGA